MSDQANKEVFEQHLNDATYLFGIKQKKWRLVCYEWPECLFEVKAKCSKWWGIKLNLKGYPISAPQGNLWDSQEKRPLKKNEMPLGGAKEGFDDDIYTIFSSIIPKNDGYPIIYSPFDKSGLDMHPEWARNHLNYAWNENKIITFYLEKLHALLNSRGYRSTQDPKTSNHSE